MPRHVLEQWKLELKRQVCRVGIDNVSVTRYRVMVLNYVETFSLGILLLRRSFLHTMLFRSYVPCVYGSGRIIVQCQR